MQCLSSDFQSRELTKVMTSFIPKCLCFLLKESGHIRRHRFGHRLRDEYTNMEIYAGTAKGQTQKLHLPPSSPEELLTNKRSKA